MSDPNDPIAEESVGVVAASSITAATVEGEQRLIGAASPQELKAATAARKHQLDWARQTHELDEAAKANAQRRKMEFWGFSFLLGVSGAALVAGFLLAELSTDAVTRTFGRALATIVVGGVLGAFAGYLTGRSGK